MILRETYLLRQKALYIYVTNITVTVCPFWIKEIVLKKTDFIQNLNDKKFIIYKSNVKNTTTTHKAKCCFGKKIAIHADEFNESYTVPIIKAWNLIYYCPLYESFWFLEVSMAHYPDLDKYIDENEFIMWKNCRFDFLIF